MGDTANPTTSGMHNHLGPQAVPRDPQIDRVYGVDAPIIEGVPIEVGHGCKSAEWQLAEYVMRIFAANGREVSRVLLLKLCTNEIIDQEKFAEELVTRGLMSEKTAAAARAFEEFSPSGTPN